MQKTFLDRFWEKVDVKGEDDCWEWTANKSRGYGLISNRRGESPLKAYRVSWVLNNKQDVPQGKEVCHKCDNPSCVNPNHLYVGTHTQNMTDAYLRKRIDNYVHGSGVNNPNAKFTDEQVKEMRRDYCDRMSYKDLCNKYGSSDVIKIIRNKSYYDPAYTPISGNKNPRPNRRVLFQKDLKEVIEMHNKLKSSRKVAKIFGVSKWTIQQVMKGSYHGQ